jgi:Tetratricopeptide repeat
MAYDREIYQVRMNKIFRAAVFCQLTFSAVFASAVFAAEPKWIHVPSADFEIFSSAGESDTRRVLQHFERVRSFFDASTTAGVRQQAEPVRVIVFGSKKEYDQYRPNDFAAAFYTQIGGRDYIVLGSATDDAFPTAVHEYVHLVAQHGGMNFPPWLNEGMAELYSTIKPVGDKVIVGNIISGRMYEMSQEKWVPLATIVAATSDSPYYNEKNKAGSLYNEGWALTHMLELSPQYAPRFADFLKQILKGASSQAAIEAVYGKPLTAVEKDLQGYLRNDTFNGRIFSVKLDQGAKAAVEPAQPFDVKLTLLDLNNSRPGKEAESRQKLTDLASEFPKRPEPHSGLGYLAWRAGDNAEAVKSFGAAFELGGRNPQMLWDYGRLAANSDPAGATSALTALLAGQPGRLDVRLTLAGIQLSNREPKAALETLSPVKSVTPTDAPRFFQILAFARMQTGDLPTARDDANKWLSYAKEPDDRERANQLVQSLNRPTRAAMPASPVNGPASPAAFDGGPPRLTRPGEPSAPHTVETVPDPKLLSVRGNLVELDCSEASAKLVLQTSGGKVALLLDEPDKVIISGVSGGTVDLHCGPQKAAQVSVQFEPAAASQTVKGSVRAIQFQ